AAPVQIISVSDDSETAGIGDVTVSITLNEAFSTQEAVYIRYTTDAWLSSLIVETTGESLTYSGIIPAQIVGTTVEYYALSSTMPLSFVNLYPDFATLDGNNNAGENYAYTILGSDPILLATPSTAMNSTVLDGLSIVLELTNETFLDAVLDPLNFELNNEPSGLSINQLQYVSETEATLTLAYTGGLILSQIDNFSVTISGNELTNNNELTSNDMTISADILHDGIYLAKVSMWEGGASDTWYDEVDFDGHDFGSFNSSMSLYFKSGQVFTWKDVNGEIVSAIMNYRIYKQGDTPPEFTQVDLPFYSEWASGENTDQLWWNDAPDEIDINLLESAEEATYIFEVYFEALNADDFTHYRNNEGQNYVATYTFTSGGILTATPESPLTEENLNGMELNLSIVDDFFADASLDAENFTLNNFPLGLTISEVQYVSPTEASLILAFDGTNFDIDYEDFYITIAGVELNASVALSSNSLIITAIDETVTIYTHLLTALNMEHYLGDNSFYWINMEIGQLEWDGAQIGFGTSQDNPEDWTWYNAEWYEDGEDENKRVHSLIEIPQTAGLYYYAGRVRNTEMGQWFYANDENWTESDTLNAVYNVTVNPLPVCEEFSATMLDGTRINLEWTASLEFQNVIILGKTESVISGTLEQGAVYNIGSVIEDAIVIYKGAAESFIHSGLANNTDYYYDIYTMNNNYYSTEKLSATASTDDSNGCVFEIQPRDDMNICGGSAVVINSGLVVAPYGDTLVIYFNSAEYEDFAELDKVYMHAGVTIQGGSSWDYVIGNWGEDDGVGLMTEVSDNLWSISINPLSYFGYSVSVDVLGINLIFRNEDGSLVAQHPVSGDDFYIDLTINPPMSSYTALTTNYIQSPVSSILWSTGAQTPSISVSEACELWFTAVDNFGCTASDTILIGLYSLPYVELGTDQTVCADTEVILDAGEFDSYLWNDESTDTTLTVIADGSYSVTVTDVNGCTGFDIVNVNFVEYPVADFSYIINSGTTVDFEDLSLNAETYAWDFNGDDIVDYTLSENVSYTYPALGQYPVNLTVTNECSSDSETKIIYVLNIDEENIGEIAIYPNPASEILFIDSEEDLMITIIDITGKIVLQYKHNDVKTSEIDISNLAKGLYTLDLKLNNRIINYKIIIN
ncbi:MAG: T9SS type A sorting domain-containing protein, partial [Bacteroidales bacterium]|nr:T9SS type A sorting domain-containing protein [Bacteroidales bacterium]